MKSPAPEAFRRRGPNAWTREDAATARVDPTTQVKLTPAGPAFVAIDAGGAVHLAYGLAGDYNPTAANVRDICDTIRQQPNDYVERCGDFGGDVNEIQSMAVGPAGDPHFLYFFTSTYQTYYTHFDGSSWSSELLGSLGAGLNIAVDSNDIPKIAFAAIIPQGPALFYAARTSKGWEAQGIGTAAANGYRVTCYLSDTPVASASDPVIGKAAISLAAGDDRVITFTFNPAQAESGKYVVAQISTKPSEANPNNNTASIMIP